MGFLRAEALSTHGDHALRSRGPSAHPQVCPHVVHNCCGEADAQPSPKTKLQVSPLGSAKETPWRSGPASSRAGTFPVTCSIATANDSTAARDGAEKRSSPPTAGPPSEKRSVATPSE